MRASAALEGKTARGRMSIFLGAILLAEINLSVQVTSSSHLVQTQREKPIRPYRHIFPSYSHKDREIVAHIEHYAQVTGDRYMRDVFELRSGQNWKKWMAETIEGADIFQLFWSTNSMRSENVRLEWEYALRLGREHFIRPTYWETPLPASPSENLPPPELRDLHFQHVRPPAYVEPALQNRFINEAEGFRWLEERLKREQEEAPTRQAPEARDRNAGETLREEENQLRRMREEARIQAEREASRRAEEEARRRAEQIALRENESVHRQRMRLDEDEARISSQYEAWTESVARTTQSGPPRSHAAIPLWIVPIVMVLGLLLLLLVGFLIWRN